MELAEARLQIYLLQEESMSAADALKIPLASLELADDPLLTLADVMYISRSSGELRLFPNNYALDAVIGRINGTASHTLPFVVLVDFVPIYLGAFVSPLSSWGGAIPTVNTDRLASDRMTIEYNATGKDPRMDSRIVNALEQSSRLLP
jgi:hypothetical protein